jgi:hypothetical protein
LPVRASAGLIGAPAIRAKFSSFDLLGAIFYLGEARRNEI